MQFFGRAFLAYSKKVLEIALQQIANAMCQRRFQEDSQEKNEKAHQRTA
jgi:hypothetical protein